MTARLVPGHHLYPVADGSWRHATPDERFTRIRGDDAALAAFRDEVIGLTDASPSGPVSELRELYRQRAYLLAPRLPVTPRRTPRIALEGHTAVAVHLRDLLKDATEVSSDSVDEDAVRHHDIVISCAEWLPDARWRRLDRWCTTHGTAWHRCHTDGTTVWLGPLTVPGATPSYGDLRGRRLAASGAADELLHLWNYLDNDLVPHPAAPPVSPGVAAIAAGLIAVDLASVHRTRTDEDGNDLTSSGPTLGWEIGIDLTTGVVTRHPVLPLPVTAA